MMLHNSTAYRNSFDTGVHTQLSDANADNGVFLSALSVTILLLQLNDGACGLPQLCQVMGKSRCDHRTYQVKSQKRRRTLDIVWISGI